MNKMWLLVILVVTLVFLLILLMGCSINNSSESQANAEVQVYQELKSSVEVGRNEATSTPTAIPTVPPTQPVNPVETATKIGGITCMTALVFFFGVMCVIWILSKILRRVIPS